MPYQGNLCRGELTKTWLGDQNFPRPISFLDITQSSFPRKSDQISFKEVDCPLKIFYSYEFTGNVYGNNSDEKSDLEESMLKILDEFLQEDNIIILDWNSWRNFWILKISIPEGKCFIKKKWRNYGYMAKNFPCHLPFPSKVT